MKKKIFVIGTLLMYVFFFASTCFFVLLVPTMLANAQAGSEIIKINNIEANLFGIFMTLSIVWIPVVCVAYIVHVVTNPSLGFFEKLLWIAAIWCLNLFSVPFYLWIHILSKSNKTPNIGDAPRAS